METGLESTLTSKGQTTIPKEVRDHLGVGPGDTVKFVIGVNGEVFLLPPKPISAAYGILHRPGQRTITVREMNEDIGNYVSEADAKSMTSRRTRRGGARQRLKP